MKKVFSLFVVLTVVFSLCISSFAADVTVNVVGGLTDHSFSGYMILSGDYDSVSQSLSNVEWGAGIKSADFLSALKADSQIGSYFTDCEDAAAVAEEISSFSDNSAEARAFAKIAYANINTANFVVISSATTNLDNGYYLVVDSTDVQGQDKAANASLLQVVGDNIDINLKTDKPFVEKKVMENIKWEDNDGYNDVADWNIGDDVPFRVISNVPDFTYYDEYTMIFHDTLDAGFTLNLNSISVKIGDITLVEDVDYTVSQDGQGFDVQIIDLKVISGIEIGDAIVVDYTALLNTDAVIGLEGNENVVYLEYSNFPDSAGNTGNTSLTGNTPEDKVIVFTYGTEITKVDGADDSITLKGAEFVLKNSDGSQYAIVENGLFAGWTTDKAKATKLITGDDGMIVVKGLDDSTYLLEEVAAPAGYNAIIGDKAITIKATTENGDSWDGVPSNALKGVAGDADADALVEVQVVNNKGAVLPETGGTGTVIFITVGFILAMIAVVFLVTRKKMSVYED
ncbi:MAG: isopeptide-forming domain-containing fimbrial protein [Clostridia bacterium]|nr:isopeptide-forming domain-containing fimbrial protein [Clostridia bacterium]